MGKRQRPAHRQAEQRRDEALDAGYVVEERNGREITKARLYEVSIVPLEQMPPGWPAVVEAINRVVEQVHPDLTVE